jgi:ADP-heptose:LPS heptosyltransferase/GT2 family glycosyltransferase
VIPSYNQINLNEICIKSLREFSPHSEIILISDGDTAEIKRKLKELCDNYNVKLLCSYYNNYFAHSVNRGIDAAKGDIVILTNNDIVFTQNIENEIEKYITKDPLIGAVGFLLYYPDHRIQHGGMQRLQHTFLFGHHDHGLQANKAKLALKSRYSIGCTAALLALRKTMTDEIGVFKTNYGLASEDTELCLRIWQTGWRIFYSADVSAIHAEGFTRGRTPQQKKDRGFWDAEMKSVEQFRKDIKNYDLNAMETEIASLNGEEYRPPIQKEKKNIGIIRTAALGDCICTTGIIHKLLRDHPNYNVFVSTQYPWVYENIPGLSGIVQNKKYLSNHCEEIIDLDMVQEQSPDKPFWKSYADHVFGNENYTDDEVMPRLYSKENDRMGMLIKIKQNKAFLGNKYAILHIGGNNWIEKLLDAEVWKEVEKYLLTNNYNIGIIGKKGDLYYGYWTPDKKTFNLIDVFTLGEIKELISCASLYIGIDSGLFHIAQCTNTPAIGIFTVADPKNIIYRKHYTKAIEPVSQCKYCLTYKIKPPVNWMKCENKNARECSKSITSEAIIQAIKELCGEN